MSNKDGLVHKRNKISTDNTVSANDKPLSSQQDQLIFISLSDLIPDPYQVRHDFSHLDELKESIKKYSQLEPIIVIKNSDGKYIIKNGERRFRAIKLLAEELNQDLSEVKIKAICKYGKVDDYVGVISNMIREDYSPFEIALLLKNMKNDHKDYTDKDIGEYIGRSRNLITEYLSLLRLPKEIQDRELAHSLIPFNKLKRLAVGATEANKEEKLLEYENLIAKYSENNTDGNQIIQAEISTLTPLKGAEALFTKKFITISKKIDTTIKSIEKFTIQKDSSPEEKQAIIGKLDEIIAKAQEKRATLVSDT